MARLIGTRRETSLHRDLKFTYTGTGGKTEAEVAGFVADGISARGEYIEVQTGSFGPLRKKAAELVSLGKLKIIYPIIVNKYIEVFYEKGKQLYRRKSNRHGSPWDLFDVLIYAPDLPLLPGLSIELALVDVSEQRIRDGKGSWRRRGMSICDRKLLAFHDRICLKKPADFLRFIPFSKNEKFTSALLADKAKINPDTARKVLYTAAKMEIVKITGKQGKFLIYQVVLSKNTRKTKIPI